MFLHKQEKVFELLKHVFPYYIISQSNLVLYVNINSSIAIIIITEISMYIDFRLIHVVFFCIRPKSNTAKLITCLKYKFNILKQI